MAMALQSRLLQRFLVTNRETNKEQKIFGHITTLSLRVIAKIIRRSLSLSDHFYMLRHVPHVINGKSP